MKDPEIKSSPTPLCDKAYKFYDQDDEEYSCPRVDMAFAKELETMLNEANERIQLLQWIIKADDIAIGKLKEIYGKQITK